MSQTLERRVFIVQGQAQGVGFRPYVWRLARDENLTGFVRNTSAGVRIEAQGDKACLRRFERRLPAELPPLARITHIEKSALAPVADENGFEIRKSEGHAGQKVLVSPDVAICGDCLADIRQPGNPRHGYAFTNCTSCGPRFSITRSIPYDRPATTMACFELCPMCAAEYADPADRRFHAQPIACPVCGPKIWLVTRQDADNGLTLPTAANCADALAGAARLLQAGAIVAIRGLGGFQLACDARDSQAVTELRKRKNRPHKALAVMARDLDTVEQFCELSHAHVELLTGSRKPIVLCPVQAQNRLAPELAPDSGNLGVMLPYTPLHALLLDELAKRQPNPVLVMTSANPQGEPICLGNREAITRLRSLADAWLLHDRDILCRVDDSVVLPAPAAPILLRRARGYVPEPVDIGIAGGAILGAGAELKAAFCLTRGRDAFLGQHIGDLETPVHMEFYAEALRHLQNLLETRPEAVVHDLHPDFASVRFARELARERNIPALGLQHHAAHAAACLAENGWAEPALALCLDGSGLGADGTIWGGELLYVHLAEPAWQRLGALKNFALPGGEAAIREPWRIAAALGWQAGLAASGPLEPALREMLERRVNCPQTSSCGRIFDAAASLLGLCDRITYEGQAAMRLEKTASAWLAEHGAGDAPDFGAAPLAEADGLMRLDSAALYARAAALLAEGAAAGAIAYAFHAALARGFARMAAQAARRFAVRKVALSGGVMQNALMLKLLPQYLAELGLEPLLHRRTPPGDGGIALGQAAWGARVLAGGALPTLA